MSIHEFTHSASIQRRRILAGAMAAAVLPVGNAFAQSSGYPFKAVRIVVPSSPGGSLDAVTRVIGQKLSELWKQPVIVDNKPGANFAIGAAFVAKAPADGYTLLYAHDGVMSMNPVLYPNLSYDPQKELTPIGRVVDLPLVLYVGRHVPFKTVEEFVQAVRLAPGRFNHASGGTASMLNSELFKAVVGLQYTDIPYKGGGPAALAVAAGEADFTFSDPGSAAALLQTERIRALATASPKRLRLQPGLPSISETLREFASASWSGLHAPAGTPAAIIQKINTDLRTVLAEPDVLARVDALGLEVHPSSANELAQQIRGELSRWGKLVKDNNLQVP